MPAEDRPRRKLRLWEAWALSVGMMGPTLAMGLNGAGVAGTVGTAVPLVFLLGLFGVALVGYGFWRLTRHISHAGSVYALAGSTIGPRAGFFGGFALLGTYLAFLACTLAATGVFVRAFLAALGVHDSGPWIVISLIAAVGVTVLNSRDTRITARALLLIEGIGILAMLVLSAVVMVRVGTGSAPRGQGFDLSPFTTGGHSTSAIVTATVFAFLSWAGFEACTSLGEETADPKRNIPRALVGSIVLTGILYVGVMFAETIGFGTDDRGIAAFTSAESALSTLAGQYIGTWFALVIAFTAAAAAFAGALSSSAAAARLCFALARDGFGPRRLARTHPRTHAPVPALRSTGVIGVLLCAAVWVAGTNAFDTYYWFATIGVLCLLVAYAVAGAGVIAFTLSGRGGIPRWEVVVPVAAIAYLVFVFTQQSTGQEAPYSYFPWIAGAWCLAGAAIVVLAPERAQRIGDSLRAEQADAVGADPVPPAPADHAPGAPSPHSAQPTGLSS
ncbi:APC family permease [Streptomyces sp. RY43-2]|uniref:APC family permease n=1 Tax=Streptomyces macrolidinus TaxID=2952607 RepID=A0ABT0ZBD8_9ACTN|nr:APC family permease [Streptomyces macrolidinus]MCN9241086.1 APC family permease [Streptomyces macrolidinus]